MVQLTLPVVSVVLELYPLSLEYQQHILVAVEAERATQVVLVDLVVLVLVVLVEMLHLMEILRLFLLVPAAEDVVEQQV
jgi:hypothetical protein